MDPIRVLLADDQGLIRAGLHSLLAEIPGVEIVAEAADAAELMDGIRRHRPHIVLIHRLMSTINCLELPARIASEFLKAHVIVVSRDADGGHIGKALRSGAAGYLVTTASLQELEKLIKIVAKGETYISAPANQLTDIVREASGRDSLLERLTRRQQQVLKLIAEGNSTKQAALALNLSVKTIESHRMEIMTRLDMHDIATLVRYAIKVGLIELWDRDTPVFQERSGPLGPQHPRSLR